MFYCVISSIKGFRSSHTVLYIDRVVFYLGWLYLWRSNKRMSITSWLHVRFSCLSWTWFLFLRRRPISVKWTTCHKERSESGGRKSGVNKHDTFDHLTIFFCYLCVISVFLPLLISLICLIHPLCENIWSIHSCIRQRSDNRASVFSGQTHTLAHTERRKETAEGCNRADEDHGVAVWFGSEWIFGSCETKTCY